MKRAICENQALPSAIVTPSDVIGEEERDRFEQQWNAKFRRGGTGRVLVGESPMTVSILQHSMGDLAALAEIRATMEDVGLLSGFRCEPRPVKWVGSDRRPASSG